jgi:hypothetical protein
MANLAAAGMAATAMPHRYAHRYAAIAGGAARATSAAS